MKKIVLIILILFTSFSLSAKGGALEELPVYEKFPRGLGFAAGELSGMGISYRHWFGKLGYQAVAGIGIETGFFSHFSFIFELGYGAFWDNSATALADQLHIGLIPQGSFQYRY